MLPLKPRVIYLHGFASSSLSRKATFFSERLRALGYAVDVPDLAQGDFEHLTISRQLGVIDEMAHGEPVTLIGSSLGGYLAALYAARHPEVERLILLAPAFGFYQLWMAELTPERLAAWQRLGSLLFFHYGAQRELPLGYQLLEDASHFEPFPIVPQPVLIFHGNQDASVPVEQSLAFIRLNPSARLVRLESGHELIDVLANVWEESESFISGTRSRIA
jgi:hypothetical protein